MQAEQVNKGQRIQSLHLTFKKQTKRLDNVFYCHYKYFNQTTAVDHIDQFRVFSFTLKDNCISYMWP